MASSIVIIDCGTKTCKFGLSTDKEPTVIRTIIGTPIVKTPETSELVYIGNEAWDKKNELYIEHPIKRGIIINSVAMEKIWRYIFTKMNVNPETCQVIYTAPLFPMCNREKITEIMFEKMKVKELLICTQVFLAPFVTGQEYGVVVSSGEGATHIVPIVGSTIFNDAVVRFDLSGRDLTQHLQYLLQLNNGPLKCEHISYFKENNCVVSQNTVDPLLMEIILKTVKNVCVISDECKIIVKDEMYNCPEAMFCPTLAGREIGGIQESIYHCIQKCPDVNEEQRDKMRKNIILTGGNTMFPGFEERLKKELKQYHHKMTGNKFVYSVKTFCNNQTLPWLGGANIAKNDFIKEKFLSMEVYKKNGVMSVQNFDS